MGSDSKKPFKFAETSVSHPDRELIIGQMISVSPKEGIQFAAMVTRLSPEQIYIRLVRPSPKQPLQEGECIKVKCWNVEQAFYFESKILKMIDIGNEELAISRPREGVALQRRKAYRVHEPIPLAFTVIEANENNLVGEGVSTKVTSLTVGGLAFETSLPLKDGDKLDMNLRLPPSQVVNVVASVLRVSQNEDLFSVSVKFFQLDVQGQNTLLLFLAQSRPPDETLDAMWVG